MYPKFKEIALDTATWTVAFLGAIEERETKSKKPFCTFHLLDGDIAITANLWNTEKKDIYKVQEKSVISVQLYKKLYNGVETYEVKEYQAAPDDAKLEDYLLTAPIPSQDMMDEIKSILSKEISETELYPLVMGILDENADKLLYWAAAKTIHHNCYGGLLYHMLRMLKTAVILSRVYRFDKELLYSAVILHDIGKLQELDTDATGVAEYTVDVWIKAYGLKAAEYAAALHIHSNVSINGAIQTRSYVKEYECPYCGQISKIAYLAVEVIPYSIEYGANCTLPDPQERGEESDETDEISGSFDSESD